MIIRLASNGKITYEKYKAGPNLLLVGDGIGVGCVGGLRGWRYFLGVAEQLILVEQFVILQFKFVQQF